MQIYEELKNQAEPILIKLRADGLSLFVTDNTGLRIVGTATKKQLEFIRIWKRQIIEILCPNCSNCGLEMNVIETGKLWFCALGCETRKRN